MPIDFLICGWSCKIQGNVHFAFDIMQIKVECAAFPDAEFQCWDAFVRLSLPQQLTSLVSFSCFKQYFTTESRKYHGVGLLMWGYHISPVDC